MLDEKQPSQDTNEASAEPDRYALPRVDRRVEIGAETMGAMSAADGDPATERVDVEAAAVRQPDSQPDATMRDGHPYFPSTPPASEQIAHAAQHGFDVEANWNKYNTKQV